MTWAAPQTTWGWWGFSECFSPVVQEVYAIRHNSFDPHESTIGIQFVITCSQRSQRQGIASARSKLQTCKRTARGSLDFAGAGGMGWGVSCFLGHRGNFWDLESAWRIPEFFCLGGEWVSFWRCFHIGIFERNTHNFAALRSRFVVNITSTSMLINGLGSHEIDHSARSSVVQHYQMVDNWSLVTMCQVQHHIMSYQVSISTTLPSSFSSHTRNTQGTWKCWWAMWQLGSLSEKAGSHWRTPSCCSWCGGRKEVKFEDDSRRCKMIGDTHAHTEIQIERDRDIFCYFYIWPSVWSPLTPKMVMVPICKWIKTRL